MSVHVAPPFRSWKATTNAWPASAPGGTRREAKGAKILATQTLLGQSLPKWAFRTMSAFPSLATKLRTSLLVRFVPKPDLGPFSGVDEGLCRLNGEYNARRSPRREGFLFARRRCFLCTAENGHAGIAGGKDR